MPSGVGWLEDLDGAWGSSPTDVYIVGGHGGILHLDSEYYTLSAVASPANQGWVEALPLGPFYLPGEEVTLTAHAQGGLYGFNHWQGDIDDPYANPTTIVMNSDESVVAVFTCGGGVPPMLPLMLGVLGVFVLVRRLR